MPTLEVVNFNIVCATLGGFITLFGLVSYLLKEKFYLSEALISTLAGVVFSPHAANLIRPLSYANGNEADLETITLYFTRLVLGVQLVLAGVQLPSKYLWTERKSLSLLLGPGMCAMWIVTSLLVWALVPHISIIQALAVGACVTPTDPILSNSIVKGKFADKNVPPALQKIIIAESGANDGLGYPFLFLALYLLQYDTNSIHDPGRAMALWFGETWGYTILLSIAYGAVVGWLAKELLHWAEERHHVDRESFLVFAITLALFIIGTAGMLGSDDVLACFIAGNAFTWDDWFRLQTHDDSLQPTIDMLLNVSIFLWFGAVCPWHKFLRNDVIEIYRLIPLGILVLLLRRLPFILSIHKFVHQIENIRHALFVGFFGPIGVSAIFYLYISREFLLPSIGGGPLSEEATRLTEVLEVVVWFLVVCSIVVHGVSIPLGKLGFYLPRTLSEAISTERVSAAPSISRESGIVGVSTQDRQRADSRNFQQQTAIDETDANTHFGSHWLPRSMYRAVQKVAADLRRRLASKYASKHASPTTKEGKDESTVRPKPAISGPSDGHRIGRTIAFVPSANTSSKSSDDGTAALPQNHAASRVSSPTPWLRSIRFPDEAC